MKMLVNFEVKDMVNIFQIHEKLCRNYVTFYILNLSMYFNYGHNSFLLTFTAIDRIEFPLYNTSFYRGLPVLSNVNAPIKYSK